MNTKENEFDLIYDRDEYVFNACASWDDNNPNANESDRLEAFKMIIMNMYLEEYEKSRNNPNYYEQLKVIHFKDKDYVVI